MKKLTSSKLGGLCAIGERNFPLPVPSAFDSFAQTTRFLNYSHTQP